MPTFTEMQHRLADVRNSGGIPLVLWKVYDHNTGRNTGYEYMAMFVRATNTWYIAGNAEFYGSAEKDEAALAALLCQEDVHAVYAAQDVDWNSIK